MSEVLNFVSKSEFHGLIFNSRLSKTDNIDDVFVKCYRLCFFVRWLSRLVCALLLRGLCFNPIASHATTSICIHQKLLQALKNACSVVSSPVGWDTVTGSFHLFKPDDIYNGVLTFDRFTPEVSTLYIISCLYFLAGFKSSTGAGPDRLPHAVLNYYTYKSLKSLNGIVTLTKYADDLIQAMPARRMRILKSSGRP